MPKAESEITLVLRGLDDVTANRAMTAALGSPFDVSGAACLPGASLRDTDGPLAQLAAPGQSVTLLRLESIKVSVAERAKSLAALLAEYGKADLVEDAASAALWASIRDVTPFAAAGARGGLPVWRIVCPPASGGAFGARLARETGGDVYYDWGGGLIWAALPEAPDAHAHALRAGLKEINGHATLLRASETVRSAVDVFQPQAPGVAALSRRIKNSFDPRNILNRGRMTRDSQ
jgi:glycolate oxidase FAD binding subunit